MRNQVQDAASVAGDKASELADKAGDKYTELSDKVQGKDAGDKAADKTDEAKNKAKDAGSEAKGMSAHRSCPVDKLQLTLVHCGINLASHARSLPMYRDLMLTSLGDICLAMLSKSVVRSPR